MNDINIKKLDSISLSNVVICDEFWIRYINLVRDVIIPYQWNILSDEYDQDISSHCIKNFRIAAGEMNGTFQGAVFQDTDVAKWIEAVAYSLATAKNNQLEKLADEVIDLIGRAQCEDGYLNTYFTIAEPDRRWQNLKEGHELYTAGHMIEAAIAYYEATGKDKFLIIVAKYADLICEKFGPLQNQCHGYPGHQEIELALVKLYRVTGKVKYLELAKYFIDQRGTGENYFLQEEKRENFKPIFLELSNYDPKYSQSHLPVREQLTAEGHAVRAVYMYSAMADLAYEYQDELLMKACERLWNNIVCKRMYITGGIGSSGLLERFTTDYDLPNDCNYAETCASIGMALFGKRMTEITRDASYYDVVEKALYNTVLAGIGMEGTSFFYVNPLEVWPDNCIERTSKEHVKPVRQKWFGVACCPPNIARTLASLGQYIYAKDDDTIFVNLYISNHTDIEFEDCKYHLDLENKLLTEGSFELMTSRISGKERDITIALRIPEYVSDFKVLQNGEPLKDIQIAKGYAMMTCNSSKDTFTVKCNMEARFIHANPKVRADSGKVAIMKGPLVYCLEEVDNGGNLAAAFIDVNQKPVERYEPDLLGGTNIIICKGKRISEQSWEEKELYSEKAIEFEETEFKAIPYYLWGNRDKGEMLVWIKEIL